MLQLFYNKLSVPFDVKKWAFYFQQMPEDIQERIRRYHQEENKYQLMVGRLLLKKGMRELGFNHFRLADLYYNEYNCPLWENNQHFNIAHSGKVVACAFSQKSKIGLDVEKIRPINLKDFDYILNDLDKRNIRSAADPFHAFFKIWTIKEAVTKAIGKGLAIDVQQIFIDDQYASFEKEKWYYQTLNFEDGFAAHLVSNRNEWNQLIVQEVTF